MSPPPKRRKPPRLAEETISTIAQTLGISLRPEITKLFLPDVEYRLREVIQLSKLRMRHSKRTRLTVCDIRNACKYRGYENLLGVGGGYMRVAGVGKGLYVKRDCVIDLAGVYAGRLPRAVGSVQVRTRWMRDVCEARVERAPFVRSFLDTACEILSHKHTYLDTFLRQISTKPLPHESMHGLISLLRSTVHTNARKCGSTCILHTCGRMLTALFSHTEVGAELFTDSMLTCTLTLILGPFLGDDAEGERDVREMGCVALRTFFAEGDGYVGRGRACKTIVSVLTDSRASLSCTYGGLRGLQVIAPYMETDLVHVFRPAVINSLSARLALLHTDELEHMRQLVLDTLTLLSPPPAKPCDDALSLALI